MGMMPGGDSAEWEGFDGALFGPKVLCEGGHRPLSYGSIREGPGRWGQKTRLGD